MGKGQSCGEDDAVIVCCFEKAQYPLWRRCCAFSYSTRSIGALSPAMPVRVLDMTTPAEMLAKPASTSRVDGSRNGQIGQFILSEESEAGAGEEAAASLLHHGLVRTRLCAGWAPLLFSQPATGVLMRKETLSPPRGEERVNVCRVRLPENLTYAPMPSSKEPAAIGKQRFSRTYWMPLALVASKSR